MRRLLVEHYPGVEFLQWPGGLVASVFSNGYVAPIALEPRELPVRRGARFAVGLRNLPEAAGDFAAGALQPTRNRARIALRAIG